MSLHEFKKKVKAAAEKRNGEPLYNGSLDHAAILAEQMFTSANKEVCILSGELNARVYGRDEVVEAATLFLADADSKVRVLLESSTEADRFGHPFFDEFFAGSRSNIEFRIVPDDWQKKYECHFMVVDSDSYRFERNRNEPNAIAAFGDAVGGENLKSAFDTIWENSTDLKN